jgi:SAM-dependent methyltransferase
MSLRETIKSIPLLRKPAELLRFVLFQIRIAVAEALDGDSPKDSRGIAIPPARLRHRVHGDLSRENFLGVGELVAGELRQLVGLAGREWSSFSDILDFGCGSARVMRYFLGPENQARFTGTDIDRELVEWCRQNIEGVEWCVNPFMPATRFADGAFDLIYAISVFSHLDESFQNAWLAELQRITRRGAVLILTIHGEPFIAKASMTASQRRELEENGFLYATGTKGKLKLDGLPDFYQTAFHRSDYIQRVWGSYFEVVKQIPEAIGHTQDAVVLRRR